MIRLFLLVIFPLTVQAISQKEAENFVLKGNQAMGQKQWEQAIHCYQTALTFGNSAQINFNLANAYASNKQPGYALLYYLKAKQINPNWKQLQIFSKNLYTNYPCLPKYSPLWYQQIFDYFSWKTWRNTCLTCFWSSVFLGIFYVGFKHSHKLLKLCIFSGIISGLTSILLLLNHKYQNLYVIIEEAAIRFAPTQTSPTRHIWPEGTYCWPKDERENYLFVSNNHNEDGWIDKTHLRPLSL